MAKTTALQRMQKALKVDENKLDKYLAYYYENAALDRESMEMLEKYRKAWSLMSLGRPDNMVISTLMKDYGILERQARYIVSESLYIYGRVKTADKQGKKIASAEYFRLLSNLARQQGDIDAATKAWEKADRLDGLHDEEKVGWDSDAFTRPVKIVYQQNINILKESNRMAEDE
ncbi:hypothetical protein BWI97_08715 [Siphonobacter sp. BAB-5405]|uniref:hypothetical protein n=1 Tax=Siphonobacter sp. BAB-5405 TaxID=1864825 RepID=UPI000C803048|nr:hypothetical protein [Siphonobacter sp. BAB-5405]PMD97681.1 hypothetical protein BWI97_08715 [Siphonobacter sp. BAB-5405]